ncbi:hypothetical protein PM082_004594 [Marasmius tenuissimus]|nr:hypothetical protein PM082_004594 [Marasmius tenuissimus]
MLSSTGKKLEHPQLGVSRRKKNLWVVAGSVIPPNTKNEVPANGPDGTIGLFGDSVEILHEGIMRHADAVSSWPST